MEHQLKCWPPMFRAVQRGDKPFELRRHDRDFKVGDHLWLREWDPDTGEFTGQGTVKLVSFVMTDNQAANFGCAMPGFCILGLADPDQAKPHSLTGD